MLLLKKTESDTKLAFSHKSRRIGAKVTPFMLIFSHSSITVLAA